MLSLSPPNFQNAVSQYSTAPSRGVFYLTQPQMPPSRANGFYDSPLPPLVTDRSRLTYGDCTTAEQKEAWERAKRVHEILNGKGNEDGVYKLEYEAWKAMGGDESVVGSREARKNYSAAGLYATAIKRAIDAMRRDDPRCFRTSSTT